MSHINQFEPSARTAEVKNNAIGQADLDDGLIGQALSIFQGLRQSKAADTNPPVLSGDQSLPSVVRNQRDLISGLLNGPCEQAQTIRNSGKCDIVDHSGLGESINRLINGTRDQLPEVRRNDKGDPAILPNTEIHGRGRPNGEESSIGRGVQNLFENLDTNALPRELQTNPRGIFACTAEVPNSLKDALRRLQNELNGRSEIILCTYRIPPKENSSIKEWLNPNGPSDTILCTAKTPITGQKPEPGNYYSCVYYYPLKTKDGIIQRQSD